MSENVTGRAEPTPATARLRVEHVTKTYPGTVALKDLNWTLQPGEVHSLVGSNGSGKSTLIKILAGVVTGDAGGQISVPAASIRSEDVNPSWSFAHQLRFVHQQPSIFGDLTVAENLAVAGRYPTTGPLRTLNWRALNQSATQALARFNLDLDPRATVAALRPSQRMMLAIVRALQDRDEDQKSVLVLDEPTAALPKTEVAYLLSTLRELAERGDTIVYVSHRLDEVLSVSDRVTVIRDGRLVDTVSARGLSHDSIIEMMVGAAVDTWEPIVRATPGPTVLDVRGLAAGQLREVSLSIREGEVVGIAGLLGSGRSTLLRALFGSIKRNSGAVTLDGALLAPRTPAAAMERGVAYVPENRARDAAFLDRSIADNLTVGSLVEAWKKPFLNPRTELREASALSARFGVKTPSVKSLISSLSGGNAQKVIMARWLARSPKLLLLDEPSQGVDAKARDDIHGLFRSQVDLGSAALVVSSDSEELAYYCDRVLVLARGSIVDEISGDELTAHNIDQRVFKAQSEGIPA